MGVSSSHGDSGIIIPFASSKAFFIENSNPNDEKTVLQKSRQLQNLLHLIPL